MRTAALFDIDGTLVDSNYLHVHAWSEAFDTVGHPVDDALIHRSIGLDSAKLLEHTLGEADAAAVGERAKKQHGKRYRKAADRLRPFADARALLQAIAERGVAVVLATSSPEEELKLLRDTLDVEQWLAAVTSSEDVQTAKPEPDIISVALEKAGVEPAHAVMIGDTVWDGQASVRAGVPFVGLRSGGFGEDELRESGAVAVYADPAELLGRLDGSPLAALWSR